MSARSVMAALDLERFEAVPLGITRQGRWYLPSDPAAALQSGSSAGAAVAVVPGGDGALVPAAGGAALPPVDVVFPVLHGPNGEDGTIQGMLELAGLPYVGAGVLGSALGMDKIAQKDVFVRHGLPVTPYAAVREHALREDAGEVVRRVVEAVGLPCFVKPANLGSSVGIARAGDAQELLAGLLGAAAHDERIICERAVIDKRELECAVLGNERPEASVVGEVVPRRDFYDYESKYTAGGADLIIPADLPEAVSARVRTLALRAFEVLDGAGMARVDFFLDRGTGNVLINEVNTIPGFTATSMYPKLWEATGLGYRQLLTRLIELAILRHKARRGRG